MMKMITLSLEAHYVPVKKLTMLYTKVLSNLFHHGNHPSSVISPIFIYKAEETIKLPQ
jgi:hypothetical protein